MRKIKEVLRLRFELGLGLRAIARSCSIGLGTAHEYLQRAQAAYAVVKKDADISTLDYNRISADTQGAINAIKASMAEANQIISSTSADIDHLEIDIQNLTERVQQRAIRAPCAGRVVRLNRVGAGETVNAGAILATIVPATEDRAAAV